MNILHIHPWAKSKLFNKNKVKKLAQQTKEIKNHIYKLRTKLTKVQRENKTKARCQVGKKAMKRRLSNMLRGKERKNRYAKLNRGR